MLFFFFFSTCSSGRLHFWGSLIPRLRSTVWAVFWNLTKRTPGIFHRSESPAAASSHVTQSLQTNVLRVAPLSFPKTTKKKTASESTVLLYFSLGLSHRRIRRVYLVASEGVVFPLYFSFLSSHWHPTIKQGSILV